MQKDKARFSKSLILSITLHVIFFTLIFTTLFSNMPHAPITVNLAKNPGKDPKIVQATMIDKRAVDQALQRQIAEEKFRQEQIRQAELEQQRKADQIKQEALEAQKALELAKAEKAKLEQQQQEMKAQEIKRAQEMKKQIAQQQLAAKQQKAKLSAEKLAADKRAAEKQQQAAALKAQHDRMLAQQQAVLASEVERFRAEIAAAIEENRILSGVFKGNISCKIRIKLLPDGSILSAQVIEPSGNPAYDEMSKSAVYKSAPFALPSDQDMFNQLRDIVLSFKNGDQSGDVS